MTDRTPSEDSKNGPKDTPRPPYFWERIPRLLGFGYDLNQESDALSNYGGSVHRTASDPKWKGPAYLNRGSWRRDVMTVSELLRSLVASNSPLVGGLEAAAREETRKIHAWTPQRISYLITVLFVGVLTVTLGLGIALSSQGVQGIGGALQVLFLAVGLCTLASVSMGNRRRLKLYLALARRLNEGAGLSEAMATFPRFFPRHLVDLVILGEETGSMEDALSRFNESLINALGLHQRLRLILSYLSIVFLVQSLIIVFLLLKVMPVYLEMYGELNEITSDFIPPELERIQGATDLLYQYGHYWPYAFGSIALIVVAGLLIRFRNKRTRSGSLFTSPLFFVPWIRGLIVRQNLGIIALMLHGLLRGGVSLDRALGMCTITDIHPAYRDWLSALREALRGGESLSDALRQTRKRWLIPDSFMGQIEAGAYAGQLPAMLERISILYRAECDRRMSLLVATVLPLGILVLGYITLTTQLIALRIVIGFGDQLIV